jgi:tetrahydromethanopterin:alpha-L-glutamate ligase
VQRIGIISAYPDHDWHAQRIALAAAAHGCVEILAPTDFCAELRPEAPRVLARGRDTREFALFLTPRALGDEGDADVQIELYRLIALRTPLVNDVDALLAALDKLRTSFELTRAGLPTPEVRVVQTVEQLDDALAGLGPAVAKPVYGSLGAGIERLERDERARARELLARRGALYLQRFVSDAELDLRAFVVGDEVVAALARRPRPGDFRGNRRLGAEARAIVPSRAAAQLAVRATRLMGLAYSGVDLLEGPRGPEVLEVNGTPSFRGIYEATGRDMAPAIVGYAIAKTKTKQ